MSLVITNPEGILLHTILVSFYMQGRWAVLALITAVQSGTVSWGSLMHSLFLTGFLITWAANSTAWSVKLRYTQLTVARWCNVRGTCVLHTWYWHLFTLDVLTIQNNPRNHLLVRMQRWRMWSSSKLIVIRSESCSGITEVNQSSNKKTELQRSFTVFIKIRLLSDVWWRNL